MAQLPDVTGAEIHELTDMFERTGNSAAAWRAYSLARQASRPVPISIQREVDRFAACISKAVWEAVSSEMSVGSTLGKKADLGVENERVEPRRLIKFRETELYTAWLGSGPGNPVGTIQDEWRDIYIANAINDLVEGGMKVGAAQADIQKERLVALNLEALKKIWKRWRK